MHNNFYWLLHLVSEYHKHGICGLRKLMRLDQAGKMDSEILWEILKFPNFEYYRAGCTTPYSSMVQPFEYGPAFWVWPSQFEYGPASLSKLSRDMTHFIQTHSPVGWVWYNLYSITLFSRVYKSRSTGIHNYTPGSFAVMYQTWCFSHHIHEQNFINAFENNIMLYQPHPTGECVCIKCVMSGPLQRSMNVPHHEALCPVHILQYNYTHTYSSPCCLAKVMWTMPDEELNIVHNLVCDLVRHLMFTAMIDPMSGSVSQGHQEKWTD